MKQQEMHYVIWREDSYFVAKCLNVEVSSFGNTMEEAKHNLVEAVELYLDGENIELTHVDEVVFGKELVHA